MVDLLSTDATMQKGTSSRERIMTGEGGALASRACGYYSWQVDLQRIVGSA